MLWPCTSSARLRLGCCSLGSTTPGTRRFGLRRSTRRKKSPRSRNDAPYKYKRPLGSSCEPRGLDSRRGGGDYSSASAAGFSCTTGRLAPPPILLMLAIGSPSHSVSTAELRNSRTSLHTLQRPLLVAPCGLSI